MGSTPTQLSDLPAELRVMIWKETFEPDEAVAFPWRSRFIDLDAVDKPEYPNPYWVPLALPIALSINAESRATAQAFMAQRGWRFQRKCRLLWPLDQPHEIAKDESPDPWRPEQGEEMILVRSVDLSKDSVYVPRTRHNKAKTIVMVLDKRGAFWLENGKRKRRRDEVDVETSESASQARHMRTELDAELLMATRHLALPAFSAYYSLGWLMDAIEYMPHLEKVYVVWDELPRPNEIPFSGLKVIEEWEDAMRAHAAKLKKQEEENEERLTLVDFKDGEVQLENYPDVKDSSPSLSVRMAVQEDRPEGQRERQHSQDLYEYMEEINDELLAKWDEDGDESGVFAEKFVDAENSKITLEFVPVRVRR